MTYMTNAELTERIGRWFAERIPDGWFTAAPEVKVDREEILLLGDLAPPQDSSEVARRIRDWREETRDRRIKIALQAEEEYNRKVSWGVTCGDTRNLFTTASVPVMTRLRMDERGVLDTLVESGVARSRSEALAWCVRLVRKHEDDWLGDLRDALSQVKDVRAEGPQTI